jgi:large conductance mechanosensitive channel
MFLVVKAINKFKRAKEEVPAPPPVQEVLLTEIRDLLKKQSS